MLDLLNTIKIHTLLYKIRITIKYRTIEMTSTTNINIQLKTKLRFVKDSFDINKTKVLFLRL
jgi:hypothetical protein